MSDTSQLHADILNFLRNNTTGVVCTVSPSHAAQSAAITFHVEGDLSIYFLTRKSSNKYQNIEQNKSISLTAFQDKVLPTSVHIDGYAEIITDEDLQRKVKDILVERSWNEAYLPPVLRQKDSAIVLIKIAPLRATWFRFIKDSREAELEHLDLIQSQE